MTMVHGCNGRLAEIALNLFLIAAAIGIKTGVK